MGSYRSTDFGQLYRRALAERDPGKKTMLLQEVQAILDDWGQRDAHAAQALRFVPESAPSGEAARPVHSVSIRAALTRAS
jgi:hypothetical protein